MHDLKERMLPTDLEAEHSLQTPIEGKCDNLSKGQRFEI